MAVTQPYRIYIFDATGLLVDIPQDVLSGSFEDLVNGGSGAGTITLPRHFVDTGLINYEYRVQFYLADSIDPWYDGHVVDFDQTQTPGKDGESITVICDGWSTRMGYAITSDSIHPGEIGPDGKLNGLVNADTFLVSLLSRLLDSSTFGTSFVASIPIALDKMSFDGTELNKAIDDIIKQVLDGSGNTFEWWVRGKAGGKPQLVIQANENPNKVTTTYKAPPTFTGSTPSAQVPCGYNYEWKNSTITDYKQTNSGRQIYNMVAAYGGNDPITNQQVYGAYKDSTSISFYGVRQKKITNSILVSALTLNMYARVYVLLNAYPQPQTTFRKLIPNDNDRAGSWYQIFEPSLGTLTQNIKQVRCVKISIDFGGDSLSASMTCTAPRPYIDNAYYAAINQAARAITVPRSSQLISYFVATGLNWLGSGVNAGQPTVNISPPVGLFGNASPVSLPKGPNADGSYTLTLTDSVTASTGDGRYEVLFADDPLTDFAVLTHTPALLVIKGNPSPYNVRVLRGWEFMVINGALVGSKDLRVYGGISADNINFGNHPAPTITILPTLGTGFTSNSVHAQVLIPPFTIINPLSDTTVRGVYFVYRIHNSTDNALKPIGGLDLSSLTNASQTVGPYGFEIGAGQFIDVFMGYAGLGDYGPLTQLGNATQIANGFMPESLVVTVPYLAANGPQIPPNVVQTGATAFFTPVTSQNQISAGMAFAFTITNQPTNGSYSRLGIYRRTTNTGGWEKYNDISIPNVATPSVSQAFTFTVSDLSVGQQLDWGASFEDTQGGETCGNPPSFADAAHGLIGTSPPATVAIGNSSFTVMPAAILASGPTIISTNKSVNPIRGGGAISAQDISFLTSEGYPDWMDSVWLITRVSSPQALIGTPNRLTPNSGGSYFPTVAIPAGVTIDVGIYYVGKRGEASITVWPAGLAAISSVGMSNTSNAAMPSALKTSGPVGPTVFSLVRLTNGGVAGTVTVYDIGGPPLPGWFKSLRIGISSSTNPSAFYSYVDSQSLVISANQVSVTVTVPGFPGETYNLGAWYVDQTGANSAITVIQSNIVDAHGGFLDNTNGQFIYGRHPIMFRNLVNIDGTAGQTQDWLPDSTTRFAAIEPNADSTTNHQSADSRQLGGVSSAFHNLDLQGFQTNQIADSDMRFGTTYWKNTNGSIGGNVTQRFVNYWGARIVYWFASGATAPSIGTNFAPLQSNITGIAAGAPYTFSAVFESSGGSSGSFSVIVMNGTTNAEIIRIGATANAGVAQRLSISFTPTGTSSIYFIIQSNITTANSTWYVGQFQLETGTVMTSYKTSLVDTQTGYFGRGTSHPDFVNTVNIGGGIDYAAGFHINTLPINRYDAQILALQQSNLVKMGRPPYIGGGTTQGKMQSIAGGWKYSGAFNNSAVTEGYGGTYGPYAVTSMTPGGVGYSGLYQDIPVKPNTVYSFACAMFLQNAGQYATMLICDAATQVTISTATAPTGALPLFYTQSGCVDGGSNQVTTLNVWKCMRGQFNSGARTIVRVLLQAYYPTAIGSMYGTGIMVWEGTKWQDYCDGDALPGSISSIHISDISSSTPFNSQQSLLPVTSDFVFHYRTNTSTNIYWYVCGGGGSGTNVSFYNPDGTTKTAPPIYASTAGGEGVYNAGATGLSVFVLVHWNPNTLVWTTTFQTYQFSPLQFANAYADGFTALIATVTSASLTSPTGTLGGGGIGGGRQLK